MARCFGRLWTLLAFLRIEHRFGGVIARAASQRRLASVVEESSSSSYASADKPEDHLSVLEYGNNHEHVACESVLLDSLYEENPDRGKKVLMICGGADNFMSVLAHRHVDSLTVVDKNPFQLVLARIKLAIACSSLSTHEALGFLGMNDDVDRPQVYREHVKPDLTPEIGKLVEETMMHEIKTGLALFGSGERAFRYYQESLEGRGFSREDLWNRRVDLEALKRECDSGIVPPEDVNRIMNIGGEDSALPLVYRDKWNDVIHPRISQGLYNIVEDNVQNFITAISVLGKYDEPFLPEWLEEGTRELVREKR